MFMNTEKANRAEIELADAMRRACNGDKAAYHLFLIKVTPIFRGIVNTKASAFSAEEKEDIVQEVLMAVHMKRMSWRQDQPIRPWLYAIARYKIIDVFRKRGGRQFIDVDEFADVLPAECEEQGVQMDVETLVSQLKGKQAVVVRAVGLEGKSHRDVAREQQMSENAVRVNFHRGLERLRSLGRKEDAELESDTGGKVKGRMQ